MVRLLNDVFLLGRRSGNIKYFSGSPEFLFDAGRRGIDLEQALLSRLADVHANVSAHRHVALLCAVDDVFTMLDSEIVATLVDGHPVESLVVKTHKHLLVVLCDEVSASLEHEPLLLTQIVHILARLARLRLLGGSRGLRLV